MNRTIDLGLTPNLFRHTRSAARSSRSSTAVSTCMHVVWIWRARHTIFSPRPPPIQTRTTTADQSVIDEVSFPSTIIARSPNPLAPDSDIHTPTLKPSTTGARRLGLPLGAPEGGVQGPCLFDHIV